MAALIALMNIFVFMAMASEPFHTGAPGGEKTGIEGANASLEAELSLARKKSAYIVLSLGRGDIELKARGITLKRLSFTGARLFGSAPPAKPVKLLGKKTLVGPRRENIAPNAADGSAPDSYDVKALEVHEMPSSFRLHFEDGTTLHVVPETEGLAGHWRTVTARTQGAAGRPFRRLWHALRGTGHFEAELTMKAADAKALYWYIGEGMALLVAGP